MIGVSPARLEFRLEKGETGTQKLLLQNMDTAPTKVRIIPSDVGVLQRARISPANPELSPQEIVPVDITVSSGQSFKTKLEIVQLSDESGNLQVLSGIKIPLNVKVNGDYPPLLVALSFSTAFAIAALTVYFLIQKFRNRRVQTI